MFCTDTVTTQKNTKCFLIRNVLNSKVRTLLKEHDVAFRSGDQKVCSVAQQELERGIREAQRRQTSTKRSNFITITLAAWGKTSQY